MESSVLFFSLKTEAIETPLVLSRECPTSFWFKLMEFKGILPYSHYSCEDAVVIYGCLTKCHKTSVKIKVFLISECLWVRNSGAA